MNGGIWYYIMDETELQEVTDVMKQHLELNKKDLRSVQISADFLI